MERPRVPPGQHVVSRMPILDLGVRPDVPLDQWALEIAGRVDKPVTLSWVAFQNLPHVERIWDFSCVTSWTKLDVHWAGVLFTEIINLVQPKPGVTAVVFESRDGYSTNVVYQEVASQEVLLADQWESQPLATERGGPVRVVIPWLYGWKSAKFIERIRFEPVDEPGYWEMRGYNNHGDPWKEERFP